MMEHVWLIITILIFHEEGRFHLTYMMMVIVISDLQENDHYLTHRRTIIVLCHLQEDDHYFRRRTNIIFCHSQEDGTWSDEPRCIEHEAGASSQVGAGS